jgi:folate-binding protein YgfZ
MLSSELSDLGLLKVQGADAKKFLQGQVTCDVDAIAQGCASLGAHCNSQGRVISLFYLFPFENAYYLLMQRSMIAITMSALKKYAVFFKTEMLDVSDEWRAIGIRQIDAANLNLQNLISIPIGSEQYIIAGTLAAINSLEQKTNTISMHDWNDQRIRDGIPFIYPETSSQFLPHDINLQVLNAISFNKGCYTGQEIIARMHYRGKIKNHLYTAEVSSAASPAPGSDIYQWIAEDWQPAGVVVDSSHTVYNDKYHLLIMKNENVNHLFLTRNKESVLTVHDEPLI